MSAEVGSALSRAAWNVNEQVRNSDVKRAGTGSCCSTQARSNGQGKHSNCANQCSREQHTGQLNPFVEGGRWVVPQAISLTGQGAGAGAGSWRRGCDKLLDRGVTTFTAQSTSST